MQEKIIERLHSLGISELNEINSLNELSGEYINLECRLPNGSTAKILDNSKKYFANQLKRKIVTAVMGLPQITSNLLFMNTGAMELRLY